MASNAYISAMRNKKPIVLPPKVVMVFLADLRAFHSEPNAIKRGRIAARQAWLINQHLKPNKQLQTNDVHDMFERMKDLL
jgi:hypothetical protein